MKEKYSRLIQTLVEEDVAEAVQVEADRAGMTVSGWVRHLLKRTLKDQKPDE